MQVLFSLLIGYLLACPLTSRVSLDIMQTEWTHIMTYVWIAFSGVIWAIAFALVAGLLGALFSRS